MNGSQKLALEEAASAVAEWKREERMAHDGIAHSRANAVHTMRKAAEAGVSQSAIAKACGFTRQRAHQLVNG